MEEIILEILLAYVVWIIKYRYDYLRCLCTRSRHNCGIKPFAGMKQPKTHITARRGFVIYNNYHSDFGQAKTVYPGITLMIYEQA